MAWLTETEFRSWHISAPSTQIPSSLITKCLRTAIRQIIELCGTSVEIEIQNATVLTLRVEAFRDAQDKFALAEILPEMATRLKAGGILDTERDANGNATNKYVALRDIAAQQERYRREAREAITPYFTVEEVEELFETRRTSGSVPIEIVW